MHRCYLDILARIDEKPRWFDERAVPRYVQFHPKQIANIYAKEAVLLLIECQACGTEFNVALSDVADSTRSAFRGAQNNEFKTLADFIKAGQLHYGDPPNAQCCESGPSMNSVPRRVLEYWYQPIIRGEGLGIHPKRPNGPEVIIDPSVMSFRRDEALEGIDQTPSWAR